MPDHWNRRRKLLPAILLLLWVPAVTGCSSSSPQGAAAPDAGGIAPPDSSLAAEILALPELNPVDLNGGRLTVVATTGIIGDVIGRVGGDAIELVTMLGPGQDSHSSEPAARDLARAADAHVIFVNGWGLEEGLIQDLAEIGEDVPLVPISAGIVPLDGGEYNQEIVGGPQLQRSLADPHVWFTVPNAMAWVANARQALSMLDPANSEAYRRNAAAYLSELGALEDGARLQLDAIPEANRFLVTNHDSLRYFARDYGFEIIGTVIPAASTLAEPSASDLAALIAAMNEHGVCTIFTETSVSDLLAQTVAAELDACVDVKILKLYTESLGPPGSGADNYIGMFQHNVGQIVEGLK
jgi:ABC-type Zn uptake system ZnuABC Zn-binding protein ZnuA